MKKFHNVPLDVGYFIYRSISPVIDPLKLFTSIPYYCRYVYGGIRYGIMKGAEPIALINTYPIINEWTTDTNFDAHYFYQDTWASRKIYRSRTKHHFDIGSSITLVGHLASFTRVTFIDIRPLQAKIHNLDSRKGDIVDLPFKDNSISSLSCLHVAEHIGLGRYGDRLDPYGTKKACRELARVLARHGKLYFSLPVGRPRLCFNAHRVHSIRQILDYFRDLQLVELSGVDDHGNFLEHIDKRILENSDYACGLFIFTKK